MAGEVDHLKAEITRLGVAVDAAIARGSVPTGVDPAEVEAAAAQIGALTDKLNAAAAPAV